MDIKNQVVIQTLKFMQVLHTLYYTQQYSALRYLNLINLEI